MKLKDAQDGMQEVILDSWREFHQFVDSHLEAKRNWVFRGHRRVDWLLESTFTRAMKTLNASGADALDPREAEEVHSRRFEYSIRARRQGHTGRLVGKYYLWALGQHYGLATPLLDWTTSPYVAAFFAFEKSASDDTDQRVVFCVDKDLVERRSRSVHAPSGAGDQLIEFMTPLSDENPLLVSQCGLFSRLPTMTNLEDWIRGNCDPDWRGPVLLKLLLPNRERSACLKSLERMNLTHLSLFPDVRGAAQFCNKALLEPGYTADLGRPHPPGGIRIGR